MNENFFIVKGIVSIASVVLLAHHMATIRKPLGRAQRLRYISLLGAAVIIAGVSGKQVHTDAPIQVENVAAFLLSWLILITSIISIHDEKVGRG